MHRIIVSLALSALTSTLAFAADLPPRLAPYAPPDAVRTTYDWTGYYVGGNLGGGWANSKSDFSVTGGAPFASANISPVGILGGVQIGANWQHGAWVYGVETDFQFSGLKGSIDAPPCPAAICGVATSASYSQKLPWFGTVRGRAGYALDSWLIYLTGGYAYANVETDAVASAGAISASLSQSAVRSGWTLGGGIEVAFSRHWTAKMEYLYIDLGSRNVTWSFVGVPAINDRSRIYENLVRTGLNYRF